MKNNAKSNREKFLVKIITPADQLPKTPAGFAILIASVKSAKSRIS